MAFNEHAVSQVKVGDEVTVAMTGDALAALGASVTKDSPKRCKYRATTSFTFQWDGSAQAIETLCRQGRVMRVRPVK